MNKEDDSLALRARLEAIPPELYNMIYDFTFTANAATRMETSPDYEFSKELVVASKLHVGESHYNTLNARLPHMLHVDRQSRLQFAKSYYGSSHYIVYGLFHMEQLMRVISREYWPFVRSLRLMNSAGISFGASTFGDNILRKILREIFDERVAEMVQLN